MAQVTKKFGELPDYAEFHDSRGNHWTKVPLCDDPSFGPFVYKVNAEPFRFDLENKKVSAGRPVRFLDHAIVVVDDPDPILKTT